MVTSREPCTCLQSLFHSPYRLGASTPSPSRIFSSTNLYLWMMKAGPRNHSQSHLLSSWVPRAHTRRWNRQEKLEPRIGKYVLRAFRCARAVWGFFILSRHQDATNISFAICRGAQAQPRIPVSREGFWVCVGRSIDAGKWPPGDR